jgi:hypothetical protein
LTSVKRKNDSKYKYNMASVVGSSYLSEEFIAILVFLKDISIWTCSSKRAGFFV